MSTFCLDLLEDYVSLRIINIIGKQKFKKKKKKRELTTCKTCYHNCGLKLNTTIESSSN